MALEAQEVAVRLRLLDGARFNREIDEAKGKVAGIADAGKAANAKAAGEAAGPGSWWARAGNSADVLSGKLDKLSAKSLQFARQTAPLSIGAGGLLFEGAKSYLDFAGKALELQTQAFASEKERKALEKASFGFDKFGYSAKQAMEALYPIQSVMHNVTKDTEVLTAAMEGAAIGHTNLAETADVLTSAVAANPIGVHGAREQMNLLHMTVGAGKMHLSTLNEIVAKSRLLPAASAQGIDERALLGAMAGVSVTVGEHGAPSYAAVFRTLISKLSYMKGAAGEAAKRMGFGPSTLFDMAQSGPHGLVAVARALSGAKGRLGKDQWVRDVNEMFGGARSASTLLTLIRALPHVEYATGQLSDPRNAKRWEQYYKTEKEQDPNFQLNVFKSKLTNFLVTFGKESWPTLVAILKQFAEVLKVVVGIFQGMPGPMKQGVIWMTAFAALLAPGAFLAAGIFALGSKLVWVAGKLLALGDVAGGGSLLTMFGGSGNIAKGLLGFVGKVGLAGGALYGFTELLHAIIGTPKAKDLLHKAFGTDATSKYDVATKKGEQERIKLMVKDLGVALSKNELQFLAHRGYKPTFSDHGTKVDLHIDGKSFAHAVARPMAEEVNRVNRSHETHR